MRTIALAVFLPALLVAVPALAATNEEKMETCKVGADADNLEGPARDAFMKKCMGPGNYEPAARREAMKKAKSKKTAAKKPAAKPAAAPASEQ